MTHEEFLNDITARANGLNVISYSDFYKLLKIIEKLKEQRDREYAYDNQTRLAVLINDNHELDEIVVVK